MSKVEKVETSDVAVGLPMIEPRDQIQGKFWQSGGFAFRDAYVVLPDAIKTTSELKDNPGLWKKIQETGVNRYKLSKLDRLTMVTKDGKRMVEARVRYADDTSVMLDIARSSFIDLPDETVTPKATHSEEKINQQRVMA